MYLNSRLAFPILSIAILVYLAAPICSAAIAHGNRHHHRPHQRHHGHQHGNNAQQHSSKTPDEHQDSEDEHMQRFEDPISQQFHEGPRQEQHVQHNDHLVHRPQHEHPQLARAHTQQRLHRMHYKRHQQHQNLMKQQIHRAHHEHDQQYGSLPQQNIHRERHSLKHHTQTRSATSTTPSSKPTTQIYVAGYVVSSSKLVIIPIAESKVDREAMTKEEVFEGVLLFTEGNVSKNEIRSPRDRMQSGVEKWRVERGDKMTLKSWVLVFLVPALIVRFI